MRQLGQMFTVEKMTIFQVRGDNSTTMNRVLSIQFGD
jgi:hypothetical protein